MKNYLLNSINDFLYKLKYYSIPFACTLMLITISITGKGQVCSGNLGENIFTDGDFGKGVDNVLQTDPKIAPGYIYETSPPPQDGKYTITNSTGVWSLFAGWIRIYDNSSDPQGYMMVVNASNNPGLFYTNEINGLCANTVYEFSADVINLINTGGNMIKPNVSFLLNGVNMYTTGPIPENETWMTYGFTFETLPGQDSLTLSLRNNAPGGNGNDLAIDNISFRPCGPEAIIAQGESLFFCIDDAPVTLDASLINSTYNDPVYQWQISTDGGSTWTDIVGEISNLYTHSNSISGIYHYRYLVANGNQNVLNDKCRVSSDEIKIEVIPKYTNYVDTICQGLSVEFANTTYTSSGTYYDSLLNFLGCDSIIVLDLTVMPDIQMYSSHTVINPPCSDIQIGIFSIDSVFNATGPYELNFDDSSYGINDNIDNLSVGKHYYTIKDRYGCSFSDSIQINPSGSFTLTIGNDQTVELGEDVILIPEASIELDNYIWGPPDIINCENDCNELLITPISSTYIYIEATSDLNCTIYDSVMITVIKSRKVYIPNAFTPNNDGLNDYFSVFGLIPNVQKINNMQIFDRWGKMIFEQNNFVPNEPNTGWDGTMDGEYLITGSFVYNIDVLFLDNETINYQGVVTLIR